MNKKFFSLAMLSLFFGAFFLSNIFCTHKEVLKVQPIFNFQHCIESSCDEFKKIMIPLLEKNNIKFVDRDPDVILICGAPLKKMRMLKKLHIFLDEAESASISNMRKKCLKNPYLIAMFKNTLLRPKYLYNLPILYHFKVIEDGFSSLEKIQAKPLSKHQQEKIHLALWDICRSPFKSDFKQLKEQVINFNEERPIDVFFAGTINLERPPGLHRKKLMEVLDTIKKFKITSHTGRLPKDEYFDLLKKSKIAISPWGNGEWCWRDYEAIYSGAIVIKPDTSFVRSVPDLYRNNKYYIACKPDFSDLEEKIAYVIENYEKLTDMRKNARQLLIDHWDHEKIAQNLANKLKQVFKEYLLSRKNLIVLD